MQNQPLIKTNDASRALDRWVNSKTGKSYGCITPTAHEKSEWHRLARDAYSRGLNEYGHRFSVAASIRDGEAIDLKWFDSLQSFYRGWLLNGFTAEVVA